MAQAETFPALTDNETLSEVISCLTKYIPIKTQGECDQRNIFELLVRAASQNDSLENTSKVLKNTPTSNLLRYHLDKYDSLEVLQNRLNQALHSRLPPRIYQGKQRVAIDFNLIPYYGKPSKEEEPYIYRSQAKSGTCSFYAYATLYVIKKGKRVTLAIKAVRHFDTLVAIITYLLALIEPLKLEIKRLYLDRGFFCVSVIRWLQALNISFVMPVIIRGTNGGTRQLLQGGRSYQTTYTLNSQKYGSVSFVASVVCTYKKGKRGKKGLEYFAYAVNDCDCTLVRSVHGDYRRRFGIESSYRMKNQCRIRTTTKNPILRFLFVALAFLIINLWIYLLWKYISRSRRGGRLVYQQLFTLQQMLEFLRQAVDRIYLVVESIHLPAD